MDGQVRSHGQSKLSSPRPFSLSSKLTRSSPFVSSCQYNIAETCCDSISIKELLEHAEMTPEEFVNEKGGVFERRMTYGDILGEDREEERGRGRRSFAVVRR